MYNSLSPTIISDFEWTCDDIFASSNLIITETETSHNSSSSPQLQNSKYGDIQHSSIGIKKVGNSVKKSSHNEYERDRRKKLNMLYSSLRELLPEKDQKKKLSIPCSIAHILKYIPELKRNNERLIRKKEGLLLRASKDEFAYIHNSNSMANPIISATCLSRGEIMIQICILNTNSKIPFSMVAKIMQREGLEIKNATTHAGDSDKTFYSLHLMEKEEMKMEEQILCEQLMRSLTEQTVCSHIK